jgi:hypothetical protein
MKEIVKNKKPWSLGKKILAVCVAMMIVGLIVSSYFLYYFILAYPSPSGFLGRLVLAFHKL